MKLSHKLSYSCRVLAQLAHYSERGKLAHTDELAESEKVPANYLVQILNELRSAGLIISKRGKQGGYALARLPAKISLEEIILAVDGGLLEQKIDAEGHSGKQVAEVWSSIGDEFRKAVRAYTLEALIVKDSSNMYYI